MMKDNFYKERRRVTIEFKIDPAKSMQENRVRLEELGFDGFDRVPLGAIRWIEDEEQDSGSNV